MPEKNMSRSFQLERSTETEDADGAVVVSDDSIKELTRTELEAALEKLTGDIVQIPTDVFRSKSKRAKVV